MTKSKHRRSRLGQLLVLYRATRQIGVRELGSEVGISLHESLALEIAASGGTCAGFVAFAKRHGASNIKETTEWSTAGRAFVELGAPWMLWVESLADIPSLAHEALHIASGVLEMRGLRHTPESEEAYTYTMEAIIRATLGASEQDWQQASDALPNSETSTPTETAQITTLEPITTDKRVDK